MKKTFFLLAALVCHALHTQAQEEERTVNLTEAGTLSQYVPESDYYKIRSLTVSGPLDGSDLKVIHDMSDYVYAPGGMPTLQHLDLGEAAIVGGGKLLGYDVEDDVVPRGMFSWATELRTLVLPRSAKAILRAACYDCIHLQTVEMPQELAHIGEMAFFGCHALTAITLPATLAEMGAGAIADCNQLATVTVCGSTPPDGERDVFSPAAYQSATLRVPEGTQDAWLLSPVFGQFAHVEEFAPSGIRPMRAPQADGPVFDVDGRRATQAARILIDGRGRGKAKRMAPNGLRGGQRPRRR